MWPQGLLLAAIRATCPCQTSLSLASKFPPFITSLRPANLAGASCNKHHVQPSQGRRTRHCLCPGMNGEDCIMSKLEEAFDTWLGCLSQRATITTQWRLLGLFQHSVTTEHLVTVVTSFALSVLVEEGCLDFRLEHPCSMQSFASIYLGVLWCLLNTSLPHLPLRPKIAEGLGGMLTLCPNVVSRREVSQSKRLRSQRVGWRESSWAWPSSHHSRERVLSSSICDRFSQLRRNIGDD